jgi:hypothetical protein
VLPGDKTITTMAGTVEGEEIVFTQKRTPAEIDYLLSLLTVVKRSCPNRLAVPSEVIGGNMTFFSFAERRRTKAALEIPAAGR